MAAKKQESGKADVTRGIRFAGTPYHCVPIPAALTRSKKRGLQQTAKKKRQPAKGRPHYFSFSSSSLFFRTGRSQLLESQVRMPKCGNTQRLRMK